MRTLLTTQLFAWLLTGATVTFGGWLWAENATMMPCNGNAGEIGGTIYQDFNLNGTNDDNGLNVEGIEIRIYACDANDASSLVATETSDENGQYLFTGLTDGTSYRVEFSIPDNMDYLTYAQNGPDSRTNVQYVTAPACDNDLGVARAEDFHQDNPFLITPCYVNGAAAEKAGTQFDTAALVAVRYESTGAISENVYLAPISTVGALWGVAYERNTKTFFSGANMRRHSAFGPAGTGAIYAHDITTVANPVQRPTFDLNALGYDLGPDPRTTTLPVDPTMPNYDEAAWDAIGKVSFGDVDLSEDGKTLYAVNLNDREIIGIDLREYIENGTQPTAAETFSIAIPDPGCSNGDYRPWALKSFRGEIYAGIVCSAETSQDASELSASIYAYDPATTLWREVFSFPLTFDRGYPSTFGQDRDQWFPWLPVADYEDARVGNFNEFFNYPQPILSDIEFDIDGSMILGFLDRMGHQGGFQNYLPDPSTTDLVTVASAGDVIRVCNIDGTFFLEGDPAAPGGACTTPTGSTIPQGPFGQEYYWTEYWVLSQQPQDAIHQEIAVGGLTLLPGSGDITTTVFDPGNSANTGGIIWMSNTTGERSRNYQIFESQSAATGGKSNGLGDLELICNVAPIEIGNYVWEDCNADGVQDPCEDPLPGVFLQLYDENGTLLDETTTGPLGEYYFNDASVAAFGNAARLETQTTYYVVVGGDGSFSTNGLTVNGTTYAWAPADQGMGAEPDFNDSDQRLPANGDPAFLQNLGFPFASYTTECVGEVTHNIDLGFVPGGANISDVTVTDTSCPGANDGIITVTASASSGATLEFSLNGGPFQSGNTFTGLAPGTYTVTVQPVGGTGTGGGTTCGGPSTATVTIEDGDEIAAPTTTDYAICQGNMVPAGEGLTATCAPCPDINGSPVVSTVNWYSTATGGTPVFTGETFDPTDVDPTIMTTPGTYTFFAECVCGPCVSARTPADFVVEENPTPEIVGPASVCPGEVATFTVALLSPNRSYEFELLDGGGQIVGPSMTDSVQVLFDNDPGAGPFRLKVTESGLAPTNCMGMDTVEIVIKQIDLVCNDKINVSLGGDGCTIITPDMVLEGDYNTFDCFTVEVLTIGTNISMGNKVDCDNIGQTFIYRVSTDCSTNTCWGEIMVEDKSAPTFDCTDATVTIGCNDDLDAVPPPVATDNCSVMEIQKVDEEIIEDNICTTGRLIERTYIAFDAFGNASAPCVQSILIVNGSGIDFPEDVVIECELYGQFPNLTDATPLGSGIFDADPTTADIIDFPTFLNAGIYQSSGAGFPLINESNCTQSVTFTDDTLSTCSGGLKIVRTFTVLDWCAGTTISVDDNNDDNVQIIKVLDQTAPQIIFPGTVFLSPNITSNAYTNDCAATGFIPVQNVSDACSDFTVRIFTPVGEVIYDPINPQLGGTIPFPGLPEGTHLYTLQATDDCGNVSEATGAIIVADNTPPTAVCDEITQVTLNDEGLVPNMPASVLDDGSTDNCCLDRFEVRRTDDPNSTFQETITFDCADDSVNVTLRVYDCNDNFSECAVLVLVDDKSDVFCEAPADTTIDCQFAQGLDLTDLALLQSLFGTATATNICGGATIEELPALGGTTMCGGGSITRRFRPFDADGVAQPICTQTINIGGISDWVVNFPPNVTVSCEDVLTVPEIAYEQFGCEQMGVDITDEFYTLGNDEGCYKILRTFSVLNWCQNGNNVTDPFFLNNDPDGLTITEADFGNLGHFAYTQIIKVEDNEAPTLAYTGDTDFCSTLDDCSVGFVSFPIDADDNCAQDIDLTYQIDADNNGSIDVTGAGIFTGMLPLGAHRIFYSANDGCGNVTNLAIDFTIRDCKKPSPICMNGLIVELMPTTQQIDIFASQFDAGSFDECSDIVFSFSPDVTDTVRTLSCVELGDTPITFYVTDSAGNQDFCLTFVQAQDNMSPCSGPVPMIGGQLQTEMGATLAGATVQLNGSDDASQTTANDGQFAFAQTTQGGDYSVTPHRDDDADNGVTALDLVLITRHILGLDPLGTPYQMIAADANRSESITALDVVSIRRVILQLDNNFPNNTSWRFVDSDYAFTTNNPLTESYPEVRSYNNLSADVLDADFVAVKIGDVNGNAQTSNIAHGATEDRAREILFFEVDDVQLRAGERTAIGFRTRNFRDILAWQGTLEFDPAQVEVHGLGENGIAREEHFGLDALKSGRLNVVWHQANALRTTDGTPFFELELTAKRDGSLAELLAISSEGTPAMAFRKRGTDTELMDLDLVFGEKATDGFALYQNRPNPFATTTTFRFELPEAGTATFTIYDPAGRTVWQQRQQFTAGANTLELGRSELGDYQGLLYYRLETDTHHATRKLVVR